MVSILCHFRFLEWEIEMERTERVHNGRSKEHQDRVFEQPQREVMDWDQ
jgi:hypothetical protein